VWASSDSSLTTIAGENVPVFTDSGSLGNPYQGELSFDNTKGNPLSAADFVTNDDKAVVTLCDANFSTVSSVSFEEGESKLVYVKVVAEDGSASYYKLTLTRNVKTTQQAVDYATDELSFDDIKGDNDAQSSEPYEVSSPLDLPESSDYDTEIEWSAIYYSDDTFLNEEPVVSRGDVIELPSYSEGVKYAILTATVKRGDKSETKSFKLKLNPLAPDTTLSELTVNQGSLTPDFDPDVTEYTINVGNNIDRIDISGLVNNDLEAEIESGNGTFLLSEGSNTFTITVKGKDGVTTKTYTLTEIRAFKQQSVSSWGIGGEVATGVTNTINWLLPILGIVLIAYLGYRYYRKKKDSQESE